jgi:major membrane immunogen (membrane-anchored lipoprotein)
MKKQLTLLIVAASLLLVTCKKKSGSDEPEVKPVKLLSRIIEVSGFPTPTTMFTIYTYDDKKRISTIKIGGTTTLTYSYHGDDLFSIETKVDDKKYVAEVTYENGRPVSVAYKFYEGGDLKTQRKKGFIYTGDMITESHVNESGTVMQKIFNRYSGGNVVGYDSQTGDLITQDLTYGTKKSIYYNSRLKYNISIEGFDRFSANDLLSSVRKYDNGEELHQKNTYTYDDDGFPVTLLTEYTLKSGPSGGTFRYTYEYKTY